MIGEAILRVKLWHLTRQQRRVQGAARGYKPPFWKRRQWRKVLGVEDYEEFPTLYSAEAVDALSDHSWLKACGVLARRKRVLETRYWEDRARRLRIPLPENDWTDEDQRFWRLDSGEVGFTLTVEGIDHVRRKVREELKERHDLRAGYILPLTGLVGATTGLLAIVSQML